MTYKAQTECYRTFDGVRWPNWCDVDDERTRGELAFAKAAGARIKMRKPSMEEQFGEIDMSADELSYNEREIYAYGRYIKCQILNWQDGPPPQFIVCHPLRADYREEFIATQGMGTWMRVDLREVLARLSRAES